MRSGGTLPLFCFPHAGGNAGIYGHRWEGIDNRVSIHPVDLPGHGTRLGEKPFDDLRELISHSVEQLHGRLGDAHGYALYGHSFGALVAFETAIRADVLPAPEALVVSGRNGPGVAHRAPRTDHGSARMHTMTDEELVIALRELDGIPDTVAQDPELRELFLPAVRADLEMAETYRSPEGARVDCPIAVLAADDDPMTDGAGLAQWSEVTESRQITINVPGGHMAVWEPAFGAHLVAAIEELGVFD